MNNVAFAKVLVDIHNTLAQVSVKGDDVFRLADTMQLCRRTLEQISEDSKQEEDTVEAVPVGE